jgi:hypothetical protein
LAVFFLAVFLLLSSWPLLFSFKLTSEHCFS